MEKELAAGILIGIGIIAFLSYSFYHKKKIDLVNRAYQQFKKNYGSEYYVAIGVADGNVMEKECNILLALDGQGKIVDALLIEGGNAGSGQGVRTSDEYIGMDVYQSVAKIEKNSKDPAKQYQKQWNSATGKERAFYQAAKNAIGQINQKNLLTRK